MTTTLIACEQLRYTWADRRLGGVGSGFGIVLRSTGWPADLLEDPGLRDLLTNLSDELRRQPSDATVALSVVAVGQASLLVAKRAVGKDGAGRSGNYATHALYDASGTLGLLDAQRLLDEGIFVVDRALEMDPVENAEPVEVKVPPSWSLAAAVTDPPSVSLFGDEPLRCTPEGFGELTGQLCRHLPADVANRLQLVSGSVQTPVPAVPGGVDRLVAAFAPAVSLGAPEGELWWSRQGRAAREWVETYAEFTAMNQPVGEVGDDQLWVRWDKTSGRSRLQVETEIVGRSYLAQDPAAASAMGARPELLTAVVYRGLRGRRADKLTAAEWISRVGSEDQVLDVAAELVGGSRTFLLPPLMLDRLQQLRPSVLPGPLVEVVAAGLNGKAPMADVWRRRCLELRLAGQPTCHMPEALVGSAPPAELLLAARTAVASGVEVGTCWLGLAPLPADERAAIVAELGPEGAFYLLRLDVISKLDRVSQLEVWTRSARTLGWAAWARRLPAELDRERRRLKAHRFILLILSGVLFLAALVLALVILVHQ